MKLRPRKTKAMAKQKRRFKIGDAVRLKRGLVRGRRAVAHIEMFYDDIKGGVRLDRTLDNFFSWNVEHLEHAPKARAKQ